MYIYHTCGIRTLVKIKRRSGFKYKTWRKSLTLGNISKRGVSGLSYLFIRNNLKLIFMVSVMLKIILLLIIFLNTPTNQF
uniref:Uncharacterized protein n=1 Tax=Oxytricha trifallax TaxID=1172189 RepID=G9HRB5_9SPIT|nr:hypothetical protein [Oxytricha trifallax]